ncbi:MaoC/PaaZ C-terminal domain-containing protein [Salirhabdus sp. Marseille-P4669]|uniref:MaoC/PaaZ C-terminal domain-containing protein n=1 Tax=Salirhabdus sp. Marseille-P4669 TaxID=2042310 RepID=UPI000C7D85C8|nr:MaoC/PaaZ C-terminal domain-containing protein [Salirhabdus sp. Marseille-P4669]
MLGKKRKLGRQMNDIKIGDFHEVQTNIEDKDLLLYLGLTSDSNPLYIQHDYASQTPFKRPLVPTVMLYGIVSSMVSMSLPGPGSHITKHSITYKQPVYHYENITIQMKIVGKDVKTNSVTAEVTGYNDKNDLILEGKLEISPPYELQSLTAQSLENFY